MYKFDPMLRPRCSQSGGITILVALMLLVFLTIVAVGMSRNSFREVVAREPWFETSQIRASNGACFGLIELTISYR
jgi:hypothetical protein